MATGDIPLLAHSLTLRHNRGGLNVAAHHILLALYGHRRHLNLPNPHLQAPRIAALAPVAWTVLSRYGGGCGRWGAYY